MKIVFVHGKYFNSWEALGLGYISAYLKSKVDNLTVGFHQGCFDENEDIINDAKDADIVAFSCTTPTFPHAVGLAKKLKAINPKIRTVVGGYHASASPEKSQVEVIDHVVVGEGEQAMLDIINGKRDRVIYGRPMEFDELAWPDRVLIKNERNIKVAYNSNKKNITSFQSHRSCPFLCKYCLDGHNKVLYKHVKKNRVRYRSVHDLLDEIEYVVEKYNIDLIKFSDPTWNTSIDWVIEFCKEKLRRGNNIPFYPNMHAGMCSKEMIELMVEANCYEIAVGIESGSPKILKQIGKGTSLNAIRKCVHLAKDAGILVRGYFIIGMPDETNEDLKMTEKFAEELELDEYGFSLLCPYPGTMMYDEETYKNVAWETADEYSNDFWQNDHLSNQELIKWQQYLINKFHYKLTWHNQAINKQG